MIKYILIFGTFLYSCSSKVPNKEKIITADIDTIIAKKENNVCYFTINDLVPYLGKELISIDELNSDCITVVDSVLESDEGIQYDARLCYPKKLYISNKNIQPSIVFESSWIDQTKVSRIIVQDNYLLQDTVHVGQKIGNVREFLSDDKPVMPDGYLYFKLKNDTTVFFEMDIDEMNYSPQKIDAMGLKDVPSKIKIKYVVIM